MKRGKSTYRHWLVIEEASTMLVIHNRHVDQIAPFDTSNAEFLSYFEGTASDQWVCILNKTEPHAWVYGGDLGWEGVRLHHDKKPPLPEVVVSRVEYTWLVACALAVQERLEARKRRATQ